MSENSHSIDPDVSPWAEEFPILGEVDFFNHAAVSPLPRRSAVALRVYGEEASRFGCAVWPRWAGRLEKARSAGAKLLGCDGASVGFVPNTTAGLMAVAYSLPWEPGDNVVTASHEFPGNVYPWQNLRSRGVELRRVAEGPDYRYRVEDFAALIDARTRVVAISLVQYSTGYRMLAEALAELCRKRGVLLCLDAIQAVGAMPTRVDDLDCDFLVADGHKWMLGPEGWGLVYVRPECMAMLNDTMGGWLGRQNPADYDDTDQPLATGARRFETGSWNVAGGIALGQSLELFNEVGIGHVWQRIDALTTQLCTGLDALGYQVISPRGEGERSGIVAFTRTGLDAKAAAKELEDKNIFVSARRGWLRAAPHFYQTPAQIERLLEALGALQS